VTPRYLLRSRDTYVRRYACLRGAAVEFGLWKLIAEITYLKIDPCYASLSISANVHIHAAPLRPVCLLFWEREEREREREREREAERGRYIFGDMLFHYCCGSLFRCLLFIVAPRHLPRVISLVPKHAQIKIGFIYFDTDLSHASQYAK
jgi:hypothetical protein